MPVYDNNGAAVGEIGKIYVATGSGFDQIGKVYYNDGASNSLIYNASVSLTNLVGDTAKTTLYSWSDHGHAAGTADGDAVDTIAGHRYYVRANAQVSVGGCTHGYTGPYGYATAVFVGNIAVTGNGGSAAGHAIVQAEADTTYMQLAYSRGESDQGSAEAKFYMIVDLTELEASTGVTYTADSFWSLIGGEAFYGTKEIET